MIDAAIFMCSLTGNMARPWADAGIRCYYIDTQHSIRKDLVEGNIHYLWGDVRSYRLPAGVRPIFGARSRLAPMLPAAAPKGVGRLPAAPRLSRRTDRI